MLRTASILAAAGAAVAAQADMLDYTVETLLLPKTGLARVAFNPNTGVASGHLISNMPPTQIGLTMTSGVAALSAVDEKNSIVHLGQQVDVFFPNGTTSLGTPTIVSIDYSTNTCVGSTPIDAFAVPHYLDVGALSLHNDPSSKNLFVTGMTNAVGNNTGGRYEITSYDFSLGTVNTETNVSSVISHIATNLTQLPDAAGCTFYLSPAVAFDPVERILIAGAYTLCPPSKTGSGPHAKNRLFYIVDVDGKEPVRTVEDKVAADVAQYDPSTGTFLLIAVCPGGASDSCDPNADPAGTGIARFNVKTGEFTSVFQGAEGTILASTMLAVDAESGHVSLVQAVLTANGPTDTTLISVDTSSGKIVNRAGPCPATVLSAWTVPNQS